ncbi:hypothetical protein COOONC_04986 [Cooperia oncophora]
MSSRMESNSGPGKTQISEAANELLLQHYPEYQTEERGQIQVKGKGMCTTFWLHGVERTTSNAYLAPSTQGAGNLNGCLGANSSMNSLSTKLRNPSGVGCLGSDLLVYYCCEHYSDTLAYSLLSHLL